MEWGYAASLWGSRGAAALSCTQPRWEAASQSPGLARGCGAAVWHQTPAEEMFWGRPGSLCCAGGEGFAPFWLRG